MSWRQWITVLGALGVVTAMVTVTESARVDADRHRQVQVLVERVRATSQEISSLTWQLLADTWIGGKQRWVYNPAQINQGFSIWNDLKGQLRQLHAIDPGSESATLERDAQAIYSIGIPALHTFLNGNLNASLALLQNHFRPAINNLDADSRAAAASEQTVADRAWNQAEFAYIGSLLIGLLLLLLLGIRMHRIRRGVAFAEERRSIERRSEERVRALVEHSSDLISIVGPDLSVRWQSASVKRMLGHEASDLIGTQLTDLVHPEDAPLVESHFAAGTHRPGNVTFSARFKHIDGYWRHLETIAENRLADPAVEGVVLSMRDITDRKTLEDELRHQAFHDALTGLANRALFEDRLAHALAGARRHNRPIAVLLLDLDDFKMINDSLGHASGDELLRAVALRIAAIVRPTDTAARLGGDEFAVLVESMDGSEDSEVIAARVLETLTPTFKISGRDLKVTASVGVATNDGSAGVNELLRNADTAMYAAKEHGKSTVRSFEEGMHRRVLERLELTGQLRKAIEFQEFELDYQPIVELETGRIAGAEALVRWAHPERGRLAPGQFIGLAEETGLIVPMGAWILRSACAQASDWQQGYPNRMPLQMSVNVSTRQLHEPHFPETVAEALEETGLDPRTLILEITESLLADDHEKIMGQLEGLRALGIRIAVDDFGTGYSALSRLQHFPIDVLKIDRSFIDGMERDHAKAKLVRGIVNLGEALQLEIVAEGIEEREQAEQLRDMHSTSEHTYLFCQGYLFSRPVSREQMQALLSADRVLSLASLAKSAASSNGGQGVVPTIGTNGVPDGKPAMGTQAL